MISSKKNEKICSVAAPTLLWNALPASLYKSKSILTFESCLKTCLFKLACNLKRLKYFIL